VDFDAVADAARSARYAFEQRVHSRLRAEAAGVAS
jgi:hypothetical protein